MEKKDGVKNVIIRQENGKYKMNAKKEIEVLTKETNRLKPLLQKAFGQNGTMEYGELKGRYDKMISRLKKLKSKK
jgi:hypothetical protein